MFENINDDNFLIFAIKAYDKPNCIMSEFENDIKRIKYIKRLFKKYKINNDLKERLILNHLIILYNVFGVEASTRMLFLKIGKKEHDILKTFLLFLNFMPNVVKGINGKNIRSSDIAVDMMVAEKLRRI
jgi:hypothetical protein